ncbi:MAG: AMP-binding protein [Acidobacteriota bacterium]
MTSADRAALEGAQLAALRRLIGALLGSADCVSERSLSGSSSSGSDLSLSHTVGDRAPGAIENAFWAPRLRAAGIDADLASLDAFRAALPTVSKAEIVADQRMHPPYGSNLTFPREHYVRLHQTSGTTGTPLRWLDDEASWRWMLQGWSRVFEACGVDAGARVLFAFSFGPFLGFWTACDAAWMRGCLALTAGGASSKARLQLLLDHDADVVCCTPTYALRLAEVAADEGLDLARPARPRKIIVAGEPGGSLEAVRRRLAEAWGGAEVYDHHGMTEVGPVSYPCPDRPGVLRILESSYLAEVLDLDTGEPVAAGDTGELVLTTLGRIGSPLLRYRTGDLVRPLALDVVDLPLDGGILARVDDMVVVRGVNLYPSAVDRVVRGFAEIAEYRVTLSIERAMTEAEIEIEPHPGLDGVASAFLVERVADALRTAFQIRLPVTATAPGALPRFDLKASRWRRQGDEAGR